ncbi:MAG: APC family permease, partial [Candidatus Bathyarchaeia archaeon]
PLKLAKVIGWFAIMASAVSQEYGAGINAVATTSLGPYPGVGNLVPLAMLITGLLLIPKVFMFQRFGGVVPSSGGEYGWMSRTIHPRIGFYIHFLYFAGVIAAIGFLAYTTGSTLASTLVDLGITGGAWFATFSGHLLFGLILIWAIFGIHFSGVRSYGVLVIVLFAFVLTAALISMAVGFGTSQTALSSALTSKIFHGPIPTTKVPPLTYESFFGTMTLFIFAYGGLSAAPLLGGEAKNPKRDMPIGIIAAWIVAIVLFSLVAFAVFHALSASNAIALIKSKHSYYATVPGILSLVAPPIIGDILSIIVTIIIAKTIAPEMMAASRTLYAWSRDSTIPKIFGHTNRFKAPDFSLFIVALVGTVFLVDTSFVGVSVVAIRSLSVLFVIFFLGVGVLLTARKKEKKEWEKKVTTISMIIAAIVGIIVAIVMVPSVIVVPHTSLVLQPSFQILLSLIIAVIIYEASRLYMKAKTGLNLSEEISSALPQE